MLDKKEVFYELLSLVRFAIYPLLELYGYFVFIGLFCLQSMTFNPVVLIILFIIFHMFLTNKIVYFMQMYIKDGSSTLELFPHVIQEKKEEDYSNINPFIKRNVIEKSIEKSQFCNICNTFKPPRCHHCSRCDRCLLKFDHHCTLLETCIGFHNYKFFLQFLFFNVLSSLFFIVVIVVDFAIEKDLTRATKINFILAIIFYGINLLITATFSAFHISLVSRNETTIEYFALNSYIKGDHSYIHVFQEGPIKNFAEISDRKVLNPYNIGLKQNWQEVFGDTIVKAFSPTFTTKGDGIKFKSNEYMKNEDEDI